MKICHIQLIEKNIYHITFGGIECIEFYSVYIIIQAF
jgi:hypothetical protein